MKDVDIRTGLRSVLADKFLVSDSECIVRDEFGLCQGTARIDIAVINGSLHGYEIKSEEDNLKRLPSQLEVYAKIFDHLTFVSNEKHLDKLRKSVPRWCGLIIVQTTEGGVAFQNIREAKRNSRIDPFSLVQLLWRDEAISILRQLGANKGLESKSRAILWSTLVSITPKDELCLYVRTAIKSRPTSWLAA